MINNPSPPLRSLLSPAPNKDDVCVLALFIGEEKYIFLFTPDRVGSLMIKLATMAVDPELSITLAHACMLSMKARHMAKAHA
jgi:hypothetical protein